MAATTASPTRGSRRRRCSRRRTGASAGCRPGVRASPSTASRPAAPVWRGGKELRVEAPARRIARYDRNRNRYGIAPDYVVYAGLVFMKLEVELLKTLGRGWPQSANRDLVWHQLFREAEDPQEADREVIVLTRVLRHAVNSQMALNTPVGVERINGQTIRTLADVTHAFSGNQGRFHTIELEGDGGIEALDRARAETAHPEILKQYAIPSDHRP